MKDEGAHSRAATLGLVLDCADPQGLAEFWSAAIGYTTLGAAGNYVLLVDEAGLQPKLLLQHVDEPKSGKNRMHFDIETPAVDEEVARLETLGAQRIEADAIEEHGNRWVVMADPEGNEFCVCNAGHAT
jgi:predicted enzyme related to lactoylglutathione lyase